ncbi:hypothetical protein CA850_32460 [Micromonospora echinospora]|uniref:Methyltransferase domain-containing protein n=1 Tax=Micromonospora echinospora TaxID=1877 RepID=A0A1C4WG31_MICEC|nr:methyltransferase domain-containing protein [Micromonospora echinospora]OZV72315.1 hypothetical protein CA850_32460 [Micromonospora echinospora]SCE95153.1 Methyltransferase domain-containing protein [Micromonospora echinospora]
MPSSRYQFRHSINHLGPLQDVLDPITTIDLAQVDVTAGQRAMDIGAGAGSVAYRLCDLVGPTGAVTAVDIDTSLLRPAGVLGVRQVDLRTQSLPADPGTMDVVTARCVLEHLPNRHALLNEMITVLRPGGHLVLGSIVYAPVVAHAPHSGDRELIVRVVHAILDTLANHGVDLHWGDQTAAVLLGNGFEHVRTRWVAETWTGGSAGCHLYSDEAHHLHHKLLREGLSHSDLDRFFDLMADPTVQIRGYQFVSTTARKPR